MATDAYVHIRQASREGGPLVFAFHGTGGNEQQLVGLARDLVPDATIVSPRGDVSEGGAARFFRRTAEGVYDMEDLAARTETMAGFIAAHVAETGAKRVIGIGYSNGANILASVMFARPDLFSDAVLMHPLIPFEPDVQGSLASTRILVTAGEHDPICPPNLTRRLLSYLEAEGASVETVWHPGGHEVRPQEIAAAKTFLAKEVVA